MKLNVIGKATIYGKEINHIEGGFGEGQKAILARDVAKIHEMELKEVNRIIDENPIRFSENEVVKLPVIKEADDYKIVVGDSHHKYEPLGFTKKQISKTQSVCVFSERGYTKLVAMMSNKNEKKWEVMDIFIDNYFSMRETIKKTPVDSYAIIDPIERAKRWIEEETIRIEQAKQLQIQKPKVNYYDNVLDTESALTTTQIAKSIGLSAKKLNEILHELRVQYKKGTQWFLYSNYQDKGYTVDGTYLDEGNNTTYHSTKWTEKGKEFILTLLEDEGYIEL